LLILQLPHLRGVYNTRFAPPHSADLILYVIIAETMQKSQVENGSGNYTEERDDLQKDITIDDIVTGIRMRKK